jgi:hypothetical protein
VDVKASIGQFKGTETMTQSYIVKAAAWLEIVVGVVFITVPDVPCTLLFDAKPEGIGGPLARWIGIGLFALGIACVPSKAAGLRRSAVLGLLAFNAGIAILLAWVGISVATHGFLLWPVVILHFLIAVALLWVLLQPSTFWKTASSIHEATSRTEKK